MANKNCLIYETLNGVKEMTVKTEDGIRIPAALVPYRGTDIIN